MPGTFRLTKSCEQIWNVKLFPSQYVSTKKEQKHWATVFYVPGWHKVCSGNCSASTLVTLVCTGWPFSSLQKPKNIRLLRWRPTHARVWALVICVSFKGLSRWLNICDKVPPCYCNMRTSRPPVTLCCYRLKCHHFTTSRSVAVVVKQRY